MIHLRIIVLLDMFVARMAYREIGVRFRWIGSGAGTLIADRNLAG